MKKIMIVLLWLVFCVIFSCKNVEVRHKIETEAKTDVDSFLRKLPCRECLFAVGESEIYNYKKYKFYLLLIDFNAFKESTIFSVRCIDSIRCSYLKRMDRISSNRLSISVYPSVYTTNYITSYQEYDSLTFERLIAITDSTTFSLPTFKGLSEPRHSSRTFIVYSERSGLRIFYNWDDNKGIENTIDFLVKNFNDKCWNSID